MRVPGIKKLADMRKVINEADCMVAGKYISIRTVVSEGPARFAFSAGKKCGSAPRRNRMRRIIREWVRVNYGLFPANTVWFIRFLPETQNLPKSKLSRILRDEFYSLVKICSKSLSEKLQGGSETRAE